MLVISLGTVNKYVGILKTLKEPAFQHLVTMWADVRLRAADRAVPSYSQLQEPDFALLSEAAQLEVLRLTSSRGMRPFRDACLQRLPKGERDARAQAAKQAARERKKGS